MKAFRSITVCGTRPEILRLSDWEKEIIFTGQHFTYEMGEQFLEEYKEKKIYRLDVKTEDYEALQKAIVSEIKRIGIPDYLILHGDTRSAYVGALAGVELRRDSSLKIVHTEAGVRCFDDTMEEVFRKQIDNLADINFCPIPQAVDNLANEKITENVYFVGDTLYDKFLKSRRSDGFVLLTIHRRENILNKERLLEILDSVKNYASVIFPCHPHTAECLDKFAIDLPKNINKIPPLGYRQTLDFIRDAMLVITDSGGVQREAFWSGTPCIVKRNRTEWGCVTKAFGNGDAGEKIRQILQDKLGRVDA